ncbi:ATP-binding protein [Paractinoplanes durhamensis]|nr:ATP-binding protein [Actinoplanes durhamensis]
MNPLRLLAPPAHTWQLLGWNVAGSDDLRTIRTAIQHHFAATHPGQDQLAQQIALVATELAGNALRHGLPPVTVKLLRDQDCYVLQVNDRDPDRAPHRASRQHHRGGGRGLRIVDTLAEQLCWHPTVDGKSVWASFPVPKDGTGPVTESV